MSFSKRIFAVLGVALTAVANAQSTPNFSLSFPATVGKDVQIIDGSFQCFSIEFAYMGDYGGNLSHPNHLSTNLLQNLASISGSYSYIRAGGSTGNGPTYNANQAQGVILGFSTPTADQPDSISLGPAWYQSFQTFPNGTKYVYQLNYRDDSAQGEANTIADAGRVFKALKSSLLSYELGNEMAGWAGKGRPADWDAAMYVTEWLSYTAKIGAQVFGANDAANEPRFQAGAFVGLGGTGFNAAKTQWDAQYILAQGIDSTGRVRSISIHDYMGSYCTNSAQDATLANNVMNHDRVTYIVWPHAQQAKYAVAAGVEYTLGETNSISCQGEDGISNVFGSALWIIDYQLYTATTQVGRMYFHQGTPYRYSAWQPIPWLGLPASARPMYYGNLFMAKLLQGGNKQIKIMTNTTRFTTYGVYTAGALTDIAIVNLNIYNSTESKSRPYTKVTLAQGSSTSVVRRLTAPGAEVKAGMSFAGITVNTDGTLTDLKTVESVASDGSVLVGDSEAVLVTL